VRDRSDTGRKPRREPMPRQSARVTLHAEIHVRRGGQRHYGGVIHDLSPHGCKVEFVTKPKLDERVWIKFKHLESLSATVCWTTEFEAGVEFERPIHPAVFAALVERMAKVGS
jgi:hypothetical protein